jgi:hypothetical protein
MAFYASRTRPPGVVLNACQPRSDRPSGGARGQATARMPRQRTAPTTGRPRRRRRSGFGAVSASLSAVPCGARPVERLPSLDSSDLAGIAGSVTRASNTPRLLRSESPQGAPLSKVTVRGAGREWAQLHAHSLRYTGMPNCCAQPRLSLISSRMPPIYSLPSCSKTCRRFSPGQRRAPNGVPRPQARPRGDANRAGE